MQRKYITDLLKKHNMLDAKPVHTPLSTTPQLTLHSGDLLTDASQYRSIVGSLQYLAFTRPDISFAVNKLSQFIHKSTHDHLQAAKRVMRYLAGTPTHGIFLHASSPMTLHAYSDVDWAGETNDYIFTNDYISTNGYLIYLGRNPFLGRHANNAVLHDPQPNQNIVRSPTPLPRYDGYALYSTNSRF
ncbi:unnamed protein product [Arabidopsis halleri]